MDTKYLNSLFGYLTIAAAMTACSDDNTVFNEPSAIGAYETDAQIMAQFVDLDNATGKFVINPDKKLTASDYLLNRNREELLAVRLYKPRHIHSRNGECERACFPQSSKPESPLRYCIRHIPRIISLRLMETIRLR